MTDDPNYGGGKYSGTSQLDQKKSLRTVPLKRIEYLEDTHQVLFDCIPIRAENAEGVFKTLEDGLCFRMAYVAINSLFLSV